MSGWTFSITPQQLDYFVRTGDRSYLPQPPDLDPSAALELPDNNQKSLEPIRPPTSNPSKNSTSFIVGLSRAFDDHDWQTTTNYTMSGSVNYFEHLRASNAFIRQDMQGDARTYTSDRSIVYPETFTYRLWRSSSGDRRSCKARTKRSQQVECFRLCRPHLRNAGSCSPPTLYPRSGGVPFEARMGPKFEAGLRSAIYLHEGGDWKIRLLTIGERHQANRD